MLYRTGLGQDSHRFDGNNCDKKLVLAGVTFANHPPLQGNSDADVVLHAVTNAISGITGVNILGAISDEMCANQGITDSKYYLKAALPHLGPYRVVHVSVSIECKSPKISPLIDAMKRSLSEILQLTPRDIGITATSGEELTAFGRGEGIQALAIVSAIAD